MIYYMVELVDKIDGNHHSVLVNETTLANFIANYDKKLYTLVNVYGMGEVNLDHNDFITVEKNFEHGV